METTPVTIPGEARGRSSTSSFASSWSSFSSSWGSSRSSGAPNNGNATLRRQTSLASALRSLVPRSSNPDLEVEQQDTSRRTPKTAAADSAPERKAFYVPQYAADSFLRTSTSRQIREASLAASLASMPEKTGGVEEDD